VNGPSVLDTPSLYICTNLAVWLGQISFAWLDSPTGTQENVGMAESFSGKLAGITLPDPEGKSTRLGSLWAKGPAVLVFLRHYG
jgi:hypothetical protein